jgi:aryl-alcohol dehydrogenase-like predicted oxidoreductase
MSDEMITRRSFLGKGALAVGASAVGGLAAAPALAGAEDEKGKVPAPKQPPRWTILNHDERMEYRRLGKSGIWVSAIALGGHWKRCPFEGAEFEKNRTEIMAQCLDNGFNYVDACYTGEVLAYAKALKNIGKREKIYMGFDAGGARRVENRNRKALIADFENVCRESGLDYVDVFRVTCLEPGGEHTFNDSWEIAEAGERLVKDGKVRIFGISTHDRRWAEFMIREFPIVSVVVTPYTPGTMERPGSTFFEAVRKHDAGVFGIKPFASNALFKGSSMPGDPHEKEDDEAARLALRRVLTNDAIAAPIPGLIYPGHVENCLRAIEERRKLDLVARPAILEDPRLDGAVGAMWKRLPPDYEWLREWAVV